MMGPPLRKLSMKKLPVKGGPEGAAAAAGLAEAEAAGAGERLPLKVAFTLAPGAAVATGAPGAPTAPGAGATPPGGGGIGAPGLAGGAGFMAAPGAGLPGAPGFAGAAAFGAAGAGAFGGGGAAGRVWANAHKAVRLRQRVSSVFINAAIDSVTSSIAGTHRYPKGLCRESS